jgi:anti-sigma factor RsiW
MATACNEFEQDLVLYHYGELSGDSRDQLASHLRACPACASYLKELAALLPLTVTTDEPGQEFWQNYSREMRHKLADLQEKKSWREPRLSP